MIATSLCDDQTMLNRAVLHKQSSPPMPYDRWFILVVAVLVGVGLLMVTSASIVISDQKLHQPFYYFYRQLMGVLLGMLLGGVIVQFEITIWEKINGFLLIGTLLLLALVLIPGVGHVVNGSARWIGYGPFRFQASEIAKFSLVIYMAGYLYRNHHTIKIKWSAFLKPMALLGIVAVLLLKEPDFGATVVIIATSLGMMFLAGMRLQHFLITFLIILVIFSILAISEPYRLSRLTSFLNPWANPFNSGYQLTQSLIAFGRGGWFGVGLGQSIQKLFYLPKAHTDFLFAVIAEELGLFGVLLVISLFVFLVLRIFWIGKKSQSLNRHFAGYVAYGVGLWIAFQFIVSMGVNSGILPTKGLTIPLVSYGGSSMVIICIALALILRIDYENRMLLLGMRDD